MSRTAVMDRWLAVGRKQLRTLLFGFRPTALKGRRDGPRVLLNSLPKAGTNLLERALLHFPLLRGDLRRTILGWNEVDPRALASVTRIGRGQYATAHLPAHENLRHLLRTTDITTLFMIRDPRDIVVSYANYVTRIDRTHPAHRYYASLPDDDSRLMAVIDGAPGFTAPIGELLRRYEPWLDEPHVKVVRFEDLIGVRGGGTDERQVRTIREVARHLRIDLSESDCSRIADRVFSTATPTFSVGATGTWAKRLKPVHLNALRTQVRGVSRHFGYDMDTSTDRSVVS